MWQRSQGSSWAVLEAGEGCRSVSVERNCFRHVFEILKGLDFFASNVLRILYKVSSHYGDSLQTMAQEQQPSVEKPKQPKSFEALTPALAEWILDFTHSMGFARTTPVQAMAIPLLMGNKDLVVEVRSTP